MAEPMSSPAASDSAEPGTGAATHAALAGSALRLLELGRRAREATTVDALDFLLLNATHGLFPYRQAVLWDPLRKTPVVSGVAQADPQAPYVQWLRDLPLRLRLPLDKPMSVDAAHLDPYLQAEWREWLPAFACAFALPQGRGHVVFARDTAWSDLEQRLLGDWVDQWGHALGAIRASRPTWRLRDWLHPQGAPSTGPKPAWWKRKRYYLTLALVVFLLFPVRLSVLAPGELVPANPVVVRAPMEGVIEKFHVRPNALVKAGQPLFEFDQTLVASRLEVARQAFVSAQAQFRQTSQLALADSKFKSELASLAGQVEERKAEYEYLQKQNQRSVVLSPVTGVVLVDDPSAWVGKPVPVGERVLRVAASDDVEVEAWLPVGDAIQLAPGDPVVLYLQADPLAPVRARIRFVAHEAQARPDGSMAYRVRATLDAAITQRVGLKGTAKLSGPWSVMAYWLARRPLSVVRTTLGL